ncbi:hypothetical protein SprV_0702266600 [Sparganum proliferum]
MVCQLKTASSPSFTCEPSKPYAELWMGTHPSGPSKFADQSSENLADYINKDTSVLGTESVKLFGKTLPFLFKVLSVNKALSIQAHPNKKLAEKLHADHPDVYKDDNHKPELAIALSDFEALLCFRPLEEILVFCRVYYFFRKWHFMKEAYYQKTYDTVNSVYVNSPALHYNCPVQSLELCQSNNDDKPKEVDVEFRSCRSEKELFKVIDNDAFGGDRCLSFKDLVEVSHHQWANARFPQVFATYPMDVDFNKVVFAHSYGLALNVGSLEPNQQPHSGA